MPPKKPVSYLPGPDFRDVPDPSNYAKGATDARQGFRVAITKDAWGSFDYLTNCILNPRKSDQGFLDVNQFMLAPRPWTRTYGNVLSWTGNVDDIAFYTSAYDRTRSAYICAGWKLYKLVSWIWTETGISFSGSDPRINVMRLPYASWVQPTEYTSQASSVELFLNPDAADSSCAANVGKYVLITKNTNSSSSPDKYFRFFISQITAYDSTNGYYCPYFSSRQKSPAGLKYQVFDALYDILQVTTWEYQDQYYDGHSVLSGYQGAASYQLNLAVAQQYVGRCVAYAWHTFTSVGSFIIWAPWTNPFNFEISNQYPTGMWGEVIELFVFKQYLIVWAIDYIGYLGVSQSWDKTFELTAITKKFWIKKNGVADMGGSELYYMAGNSELYSLQQSFNSLSQSYTYLMLPKNIGNAQQNFLNGFSVNVCAGFDGRRMYLYGEDDGTKSGTTLVYDLNVGWWFDWTGIRPRRIISEGGVTYIAEGGRTAVSYFDHTIFEDRYDGSSGDQIQQRCRIKNQFLGDVFRVKGVQDMSFWFDDYDQRVTLKMFASTIRSSGTVQSVDVDIKQSDSASASSSSTAGRMYGQDQYGTSMFGIDSGLPTEAFPNLWRVQLQNQNEFNVFRIEVSGRDGYPFYLNEIGFRAGL